MKSTKYNGNLELLKMIWTASRRDLFLAMPWLPMYSLAEVGLAIGSSMLLQLLFTTTQTVQLTSLIPGNLRHLVPLKYALDKSNLLFFVPILIVTIAFIKLIARFMSSYLTERAGHRTSYYLR